MKKNWQAILVLSTGGSCFLACLAIWLGIAFAPALYQTWLAHSSLRVGSAAPDFQLTSLDGRTVRLSQFNGQPVLLTFGASWCPDCRAELPLLRDLHKTQPGLVILLVDSNESSDEVQTYADEFDITNPVLLDRDGKVAELYQVAAIPTGLFIDKDGMIQAKLVESVTPELLAKYLPRIGINP